MRRIEGKITNEIRKSIGKTPIDKSRAYPVETYRKLVEHVAKLAYLNKDYLLFFRGQGADYRTRFGGSTFYPTIYREEYSKQDELDNRFKLLDHASRELRNIFKSKEIQGYDELIWKKYLQWGVLQHYEVCDTPLLDFTHSLRVACSFALADKNNDFGYIFLFGLPYIMNRVSHNSEHNIVNIRLLSICPPEALRPYFQEGYLACTEDITNEYESKEKLDFKNRLIAKFRIPNNKHFWSHGFSRIPKTVLNPMDDKIDEICKGINLNYQSQFLSGNLGEFLQEWTKLEKVIIGEAREKENRLFSINNAINVLSSTNFISSDLNNYLHDLRKFRNIVVHDPEEIKLEDIENNIAQVKKIRKQLKSLT